MSDELVKQDTEVRGFHGTFLEAGQEIMKNGFIPGTSEKSYLGKGVYFFEDQEEHARNWAKKRFRENRTGRPSQKLAVLKSKIRWGVCLNLTDPAIYRMMIDCKAEVQIRLNKEISLAQAVYYAAQTLKADTVRAIRTPRDAKLDDLRFSSDSELILNVMNPANISETEIHWTGSAV